MEPPPPRGSCALQTTSSSRDSRKLLSGHMVPLLTARSYRVDRPLHTACFRVVLRHKGPVISGTHRDCPTIIQCNHSVSDGPGYRKATSNRSLRTRAFECFTVSTGPLISAANVRCFLLLCLPIHRCESMLEDGWEKRRCLTTLRRSLLGV